MRWRSYLLVLLVLILLALPVLADVPDPFNTTFSGSKEWIVANNVDSTVLTLEVKNSSGGVIPGLSVQFSVNNSSFGSFLSPSAITGSDGKATTTFRAKTTSGTAEVNATIFYFEGSVLNSTVISNITKIDHDTPTSVQMLRYNNTATVGSETNISLRLQDVYGNIVDNLRNPEYVSFTVVTRDESRFWNTTALNFTNTSITLQNNETGWIIANITLDTNPGDTRVSIVPLDKISERTINIERVADGEPVLMRAVRRDPSVPYVPANGKDYFVITYQLFDQYDNILNNKLINLSAVWISGDYTAPEWNPNVTTTYQGLAAEQYGPFKEGRTFNATLIATAQENKSVQISLPVEFYDPSPVDLLLSLNPKNLPSLDVNGTSRAVITAVVVDRKGKGVPGEMVYFSNGDIVYSVANPNVVQPPLNVVPSIQTGTRGFAYADFIPGEFALNEYRAVTGTRTITGSWNGREKTVTPIWKNYGYLKITTWVDNSSIEEGQEVKVGVEVVADGPSYTSRPIDMIFCVDRGAKMLLDTYNAGTSGDQQDKMVYLYEHSAVLINELTECPIDQECDRAGVVSFGPGNSSINWPDMLPGDDTTKGDDGTYKDQWYPGNPPGQYTGYEDFATIDTSLTFEFKHNPNVSDTIDSLRPFGDPWKGNKENVPLRYGLYESINEMIGLKENDARPEAIRAIVVLTDHEWNDWGNPTAGWDGTRVKTEQAVTNKAPWKLPDSGINQWVPFDVFGRKDGLSVIRETNVAISDDRQNMAIYAQEHGIIIYTIAYPKKDTNIPTSREEVLRYLADSTGGMYFEARNGTDLKTIFELIGKDLKQRASINTTAVFNFTNVRVNTTYIVPGTDVFNYSYVKNESTTVQKWNSTGDLIESESDFDRNDTLAWLENKKLEFNLGTMYSGDKWWANFTLISKTTGIVELFEDSFVFTDLENDAVIVVPQPILQMGGISFGDVPTSDLDITSFDLDESMNLVYTIEYSGNKTVHARIFYRKAGDVTGDWKQIAARNYNQCKDVNCWNSPIEDGAVVNKWTLGSGEYMFMINAWAADTRMDTEYAGPITIKRKFFILLR